MENAKAADREFVYEVLIKQEPFEVEYQDVKHEVKYDVKHDVKHEVKYTVKHEVGEGSDDGARLNSNAPGEVTGFNKRESTQMKVSCFQYHIKEYISDTSPWEQ